MSFKKKFAVAAIVAAGTLSGTAFAATTTGTFTVSANVNATCSVSATNMNYNNYTGAQLDTTSTVSPNCTNGTTYSIGLDAGAGAGATVAVRKLTGTSTTLNYSLYTTTARTSVWGNTVGTDTVAGTGTGNAQNVTIYGRIPGGQSVGSGAFSDTITVTVTY